MREVNVHEAKTHLSRLLARVERGEEVVINRAGKPVARLVPAVQPRGPRVLGGDKGKVFIADDFDAPLPKELLAAFRKVRILLDTQCWLWMQAEPHRLSARARTLLTEAGNELLLSAASAWEIAIKTALGRLRLPEPVAEYVTSRMARHGIRSVPIEQAHALRVAELPAHHRDPFDRILIAQAQIEKLPILTSDRVFRAYDVKVMRA